MLRRQSMECRFKIFVVLFLLLAGFFLNGCITYQIARYVEGDEVVFHDDRLEVGKTTLGEVLSLLGAPDKVGKAGGEDLIVYERALLYRNRIKLGVPIPLCAMTPWHFFLTLREFSVTKHFNEAQANHTLRPYFQTSPPLPYPRFILFVSSLVHFFIYSILKYSFVYLSGVVQYDPGCLVLGAK